MGYFILIMAAAAAACEPKDQFSDQKEKHTHFPTNKLTQSINCIREGQLLQRAHGWGWVWRNLGCPAGDTQIQAEIPRGSSLGFPPTWLPLCPQHPHPDHEPQGSVKECFMSSSYALLMHTGEIKAADGFL